VGPSSWYRDGLGSVGRTKLIFFSEYKPVTAIKQATKAEIKERLQVHFQELQDTNGHRMEYAVQEVLKYLGIPFIANIKFIVDGKEAEIDIYFPGFRTILEIKYWSPKVNRVETFWVTGKFWIFQRLFSEFLRLPIPTQFRKVMNIEEASDFIASLIHGLPTSQGLPVSP